jgi:hypothetical protein
MPLFPYIPYVDLLAKVGLCSALLVGCQGGSSLAEIGACSLNERLDRSDDTGGVLALEGFGLESLDDVVEDLCGLREDGLVLPR